MSETPADPLRFGGDCPPISYRVEGSGYVRVEAAGAGERVAEPHVAIFASLTEITVGGDADTDAWSLAVSLTRDAARSFAADLHTVASDEEYREEAYTTTPALAVTLRGETPEVSLDVTRVAAEIAVDWHTDAGSEVCLFPDRDGEVGGMITLDRGELPGLADRLEAAASAVGS
jgi:hypothetical protein